ncbi:MAG: hypothetical protein AAF408_19125, partial [Pseudomonadota bacterium]
AFLIAVVTAAGSAAQPVEEGQTITYEQGMAYAIQTLRVGRPDLTLELAERLRRARPKDPLVHYLKASAHAGLGDVRNGRKSAARAYRLSDSSASKFQAAQLAARLSVQEEKPTLAQIWLRRTAIHAPDEQTEELIARDYKALRQINPWALRIRAELRPSNNVNNGSDTSLQIIDGVPVIGILSGASLALSGLIGSVDMIASYRLDQTNTSLTSVGGRLYVQKVKFSSEAKELAPNVDESRFDATYAELSLRHAFTVGKPGFGGSAAVDFASGSSYWGGERNYNFARLAGERTWRYSDGSRFRFSALAETRFASRFPTNEADILGLGAMYFRPLKNGDNFTVDLAYRDTEADNPNGTFESASIRLAYGLGRPVGPARIDAGLVFGYSHYPVFRSGGFILVPGGRRDRSIYADVNFFFDRYDYAGFAPMLRLRAGKRSSNDSRFNFREISLSMGIESKF